MSDITYRVKSDDTISHAMMTLASLKQQKRRQYKAQVGAVNQRKSLIGSGKERVVGGRTTNPYGNQYKSPYYDPVYRHNYYEQHKTHKTRPYGVGGTTSKSKGGSGSGKGGSGSGKGGSGSAKGGKSGSKKGLSKKSITSQIEKLREESSLETEAHREAAKRKIADLRAQIEAEAKKLSGHEEEEGLNVAEIRGTIQSLKDQIEDVGLDLNKWIENEKEALERRIAALTGKKYDESAKDKAKQQQTKKDKEVNSRADKLYKRKYN